MRIRAQKPDTETRRRPVTTTQPGVFSYYSQRPNAPDLNPQQNSRKQTDQGSSSRLRWGLLPTYIALLAIIGTVLYSLWLQPSPRINLVSQPQTVYRNNADYQRQIEMIWRRSILNQNKLTVRSQQLRQDILAEFGEIGDVRIDLPLLGRRPALTLVPAQPAFELVSGNGIYYVSSSGKIMAQTKDVTKNQLDNLPLVRDESGLKAEVGKVVLPADQAKFLSELYAQLMQAHVPVQSISLPNNAANQADVHLTDKPYYVKFLIQSDVRQAVGSYLAVRDKLQGDGITPKQYIDVRVEEKVFYQ